MLGLCRSTLYYQPQRGDEYNELLMRLIDECYTKTPYYGSRKIKEWLKRKGYEVNRKRVQRLMREMGLEAMYPKPRLSIRGKDHRRFPYLLKGVEIIKPNQVWSTDITYIRMKKGFVYLMAIMDWYSRYMVEWEVSLTLESDFCVNALKRALSRPQPEIFNSDQGSQFTSEGFIKTLETNDIRISMDGRGRAYDNIFIERLWRSLKYEEVYLNDYETVREAIERIGRYFTHYNHERPHQSLRYKTPSEMYFGGKEKVSNANKLFSFCPMGQKLRGLSPA